MNMLMLPGTLSQLSVEKDSKPLTLMPFEKGRVGTLTVVDDVTLDEVTFEDVTLDEIVLDDVADEVLDEFTLEDVFDEVALEEDGLDGLFSEDTSPEVAVSLDGSEASEEPSAAFELPDRLPPIDDLSDEESPSAVLPVQEHTEKRIGIEAIMQNIRRNNDLFIKATFLSFTIII